ncbi:MAG: hypothetical protein C4303_05190 [candidate division GAL15 bacterium]
MSGKKGVGNHAPAWAVKSRCDGYWEWFERVGPPAYEITGKYLFFCRDRELLVRVGLEELRNGGFHLARTHMAGVQPPSAEYVLCLYYRDDSRKKELEAKYRGRPGLKHRKEFPDRLSPEEPEERRRFQEKRGG